MLVSTALATRNLKGADITCNGTWASACLQNCPLSVNSLLAYVCMTRGEVEETACENVGLNGKEPTSMHAVTCAAPHHSPVWMQALGFWVFFCTMTS